MFTVRGLAGTTCRALLVVVLAQRTLREQRGLAHKTTVRDARLSERARFLRDPAAPTSSLGSGSRARW